MSERLALMQLQNELRVGSETDRAAWREGLEQLGFGDAVLQNRTRLPGGLDRTGDPFVAALDELSGAPEALHRARFDEVAPIEKLDLLIRLSKARVSLTPQEENAVEAVAKTLLDPAARDDSAQVKLLLKTIDKVLQDQQVIRIPDLEGDQRLEMMTRPQAPRVASGSSGTVQDVLHAPARLRLAKGLLDHPVVVVDTCIYKAIVDGEAEYPVHLRTTISWETGALTVANFKALLEPEKWPKFNPFWLGMTKIQPKGVAAVSTTGLAAAPLTTAQAATNRADPYIAHVHSIGWTSLGTYHEQVGFDSGPNAPVPVGKGATSAKGAKDGLYPDTYLYFSRAKSTKTREVMTYTLLRRLPPLCVDDGCIEVKQTAKGVDVITTKSLYVSGVGKNTELAGILAYMAAYCGWGANTLSLVSNAALN